MTSLPCAFQVTPSSASLCCHHRHHQHREVALVGDDDILFQQQQNKEKRKGPWTKTEDERLLRLISIYGPERWSRFGPLMGTRSGKQCFNRWKYLDSRNVHCKFSPEEDEFILAMQKKHGNKWAFIASKLPGRIDNSVKNRWHVLNKKRRREHGVLRDVVNRESARIHKKVLVKKVDTPSHDPRGDEMANRIKSSGLQPPALPPLPPSPVEEIEHRLSVELEPSFDDLELPSFDVHNDDDDDDDDDAISEDQHCDSCEDEYEHVRDQICDEIVMNLDIQSPTIEMITITTTTTGDYPIATQDIQRDHFWVEEKPVNEFIFPKNEKGGTMNNLLFCDESLDDDDDDEMSPLPLPKGLPKMPPPRAYSPSHSMSLIRPQPERISITVLPIDEESRSLIEEINRKSIVVLSDNEVNNNSTVKSLGNLVRALWCFDLRFRNLKLSLFLFDESLGVHTSLDSVLEQNPDLRLRELAKSVSSKTIMTDGELYVYYKVIDCSFDSLIRQLL